MPEGENDRPGSTDTRAESEGGQRTAPTDEREQKQDDPPQQEWKWLYSSNLVQYLYRKNDKTLTIIFHGNRKYTYRGVDQDTADGLGTAGSPGHYFSTKIKGQYPFSRGDGGGGQGGGQGGGRGGGGDFGGRGATGEW